jgi:DNA-binding phage protein
MKDISYDDHMAEWLKDPGHAAAYLTDSLEEGDCDTLALALERVLKAQSRDTALPQDGLEAVCRLKPLLEALNLHLSVTAR